MVTCDSPVIYALLVFQAETALNIARINFYKGLNIEDGTGDFLSGVVKALSDFLSEMRLGEIRNFETREKSVLVVKSGGIIAALVCDTGSNIDIYSTKLKIIAEEFESTTDISKWHGDTEIFAPATEKARRIIELTPDDVKVHLTSALVKMAEGNVKVLGFKVLQGEQVVGGDFKAISNPELASLLQTNQADMFYQNIADFEGIVEKYLKDNAQDNLLENFGKFALLKIYIYQDISIVLVLDGNVSIGTDMPAIYHTIDKYRRF